MYVHIHTVELGYNGIGYCDTLSIASGIPWYQLMPHKTRAFRPCLVWHSKCIYLSYFITALSFFIWNIVFQEPNYFNISILTWPSEAAPSLTLYNRHGY